MAGFVFVHQVLVLRTHGVFKVQKHNEHPIAITLASTPQQPQRRGLQVEGRKPEGETRRRREDGEVKASGAGGAQ